ncbi:MAG TPA: hypothetical protein VFQ39_06720 [Longimicrobium sp.]|nr:hypothetical protein [Longimicrobium sp.]
MAERVRAVAAGGPGEVVLALLGIRFDRPPSHTYDVYVELPEGEVPDPHSLHYVGSVGWYGRSGSEQSLSLPATQAARELAARGEWNASRARVTFVPARVEAPPGAVLPPPSEPSYGTIREVRLGVA